ncbi:MAG: cation transporter, partial [Acinetobacter sp.]
MRSTTWISVLVALFMFQSLWNVAAAFCIHEE